MDARNAAVSLLARRAHSRHELKQKLLRKGFEAADVKSCLDDLEERGLLDDAKTATALAAWRSRTGRGRGRIASELAGKGVSRTDADAALASLDPRDEAKALRAALERRERALPPGLTGQARSKKLFDHLARRGFAPAAILEALHRKGDSSDDEP
ncbi:MAG TPA: regulatory protein RecX [Thermoanaerobaculia bacterium]